MNDERIENAICEALNSWFSREIRNSPVARSTEAYNHVRGSMFALKEALVAGVAGAIVSEPKAQAAKPEETEE